MQAGITKRSREACAMVASEHATEQMPPPTAPSQDSTATVSGQRWPAAHTASSNGGMLTRSDTSDDHDMFALQSRPVPPSYNETSLQLHEANNNHMGQDLFIPGRDGKPAMMRHKIDRKHSGS